MDAQVLDLIQTMASTSISFVSSVVTNLWGLLASLFVLFGLGGWFLHRVSRIGR